MKLNPAFLQSTDCANNLCIGKEMTFLKVCIKYSNTGRHEYIMVFLGKSCLQASMLFFSQLNIVKPLPYFRKIKNYVYPNHLIIFRS
jgi:hypothetical protein